MGFLAGQRPGPEFHRVLIRLEAVFAVGQMLAKTQRRVTGFSFREKGKLVGR